MWYLRWTPYAVQHLTDPFFTAQLNAPFGLNAMWNTPIIALAVVASPVTLRFGPMVAYNMVITAAITPSSWCAFLALRRYTRARTRAVAERRHLLDRPTEPGAADPIPASVARVFLRPLRPPSTRSRWRAALA